MNLSLSRNPRILLESAGVGWLWDIVFIVITIGLVISFVVEIFKIQKAEKPDFAGVAWKSVMIIVLYRFLPDFIEKIMEITYDLPVVAQLDDEFYKAFSLYSSQLAMTFDPQSVNSEICSVFADFTFANSEIRFLTSFYFQYFVRFFLFALMALVWISKEVVFSYGWGTLISLNMVGLCFALVFPAFPNRGFGSIGAFFRSVAVLLMWPVFYTIFLFIAGGSQIETMKLLQNMGACPYNLRIGSETVQAVSGLVFMALGIIGIPFVASKTADSEQLKSTLSNIKTIAVTQIEHYRVRR